MTEKDELRRIAKEIRKKVPDRAQKSAEILARALRMDQVQSANVIFTYMGKGSEVATHTLFGHPLVRAKRLGVPYMIGDTMRIAEVKAEAELESGSFGILEPTQAVQSDLTRQLFDELVDVAFIPALAFDLNGHRLGHGKGHFDRILPSLSRRALCVGLAFEDQIVARLPVEAHDFAVDMVVTENRIIRCRDERTSHT